MFKLLTYSFFILFLIACNQGAKLVHTESITIDGAWTYDQMLKTQIEIKDTNQLYDLVLGIEHKEDFGYENIYLEIETKFPSDKKIKTPVSLELSDKMGLWYGECKSSYCKIDFPLRESFRFKSLGKHQFNLGQFTRMDSLTGAKSLSLSLYEAEKEKK